MTLQKFNTAIRYTAIFSFVLVIALCSAWAVTYYSESKVFNHSGGNLVLVKVQGMDRIKLTVPNGSLDDYLAEQGISDVEITADLEEEWVDTGGGTGYYRLTFTFGPSGAYFTPNELELELKGAYASDDTDVMMYDEIGEALPWTRNGQSDKITFYIPHFSEYSYDYYEY